ncbi:MAG: hypothetical protein KGR42_02600 [Acidobacteria bacterium]|nr:hypothetical protein [Acidobacteriota bacterium]
MSDDAFESERQKDTFVRLFGATEKELTSQGIDPDAYARQNIRNALKDRGKWDLMLPKSIQYGLLWTRWGVRGFIAMSIGIGFLAVSKYSPLHWVGIISAYLMWIVTLVTYILMLKYRRMYIAACHAEKVPTSWRRKRTNWSNM